MKKIAVLLLVGVMFLMGATTALAQQVLPGLKEELQQAQEREIQLPDYSGWEVAQVIGYDTDLDGQTDYYTKVFVLEKAEGNVLVQDVLQASGKFGQEPELIVWQAAEKTFQDQEARPKFQKLIIMRDGKYYEVSPQVFDEKANEFSESLPKYPTS